MATILLKPPLYPTLTTTTTGILLWRTIVLVWLALATPSLPPYAPPRPNLFALLALLALRHDPSYRDSLRHTSNRPPGTFSATKRNRLLRWAANSLNLMYVLSFRLTSPCITHTFPSLFQPPTPKALTSPSPSSPSSSTTYASPFFLRRILEAINDHTELAKPKRSQGSKQTSNTSGAQAESLFGHAMMISGIYFIYRAPLEIIIVTVFLYQCVSPHFRFSLLILHPYTSPSHPKSRLPGISAFAGFIDVLLGWPLNSSITRSSIRIQKGVMAARDRRMGC
ncbi:uncharacterized protein STEHIDRAFT_159516 [Stereum hirsutum FP-91666 SS1]|uniref:uncharacterized protein n=1 Tax=Stereum hirsutum (strain FP-91666) TaxID=721885 RepID=UPI000444997F|nr:uncharacterized protein STEHIDRAFT_159516 [Stereum hirsutum FP-91666 SS1]EIM83906.1 hypothetical protein STEHIDRAFT_159516 [Stereum hirsutum FP-91666 SS1]